MSTFIPAFEICLSNDVIEHPDNFSVNPGQWVTCDGVKGRIVDSEKLTAIFRHKGESFRLFNLRFKKALALHRGITRTRRSLRAVSAARRQLPLHLPEVTPEILQATSTTLHRELNKLNVQFRAALVKANAGDHQAFQQAATLLGKIRSTKNDIAAH